MTSTQTTAAPFKHPAQGISALSHTHKHLTAQRTGEWGQCTHMGVIPVGDLCLVWVARPPLTSFSNSAQIFLWVLSLLHSQTMSPRVLRLLWTLGSRCPGSGNQLCVPLVCQGSEPSMCPTRLDWGLQGWNCFLATPGEHLAEVKTWGLREQVLLRSPCNTDAQNKFFLAFRFMSQNNVPLFHLSYCGLSFLLHTVRRI